MASVADCPRRNLLGLLRGNSFVIPGLQDGLKHWPHEVSPELRRLEKDVCERLEWQVYQIQKMIPFDPS